MTNKINNIFEKYIIYIFYVYLFLQPILDSILGVMYYFEKNTFILSVIKIIFIIIISYYVFIIKKKYKYLPFIIIYSICFIFINYYLKNYSLLNGFEMILKNVFLPISILFIIEIKDKLKTRYLYLIFYLYLILVLIPNVFNIGLNSYAYAKEGQAGFFYSANALGNVFSMLYPIVFYELIKIKKYLLLTLSTIVYLYVIINIGTKAPLLCFGMVIIYLMIYAIMKLVKNKKYTQVIILFSSIIIITILGFFIIKKSAFYDNILIHLNFLEVKKIKDLLNIKIIDHFIFSSRLTFLKNSFNIYIKSSLLEKILGVGYLLNGKIIKTAEMDYFVIFIHQGLAGFILIFYDYIKYIVNIIIKYLSNIKEYFKNIECTLLIISLVISIFSALLVGHVLETPSVSIFVSTIIGICINKFEVK